MYKIWDTNHAFKYITKPKKSEFKIKIKILVNFEKNIIFNYFINQNGIFIFQYSLIVSSFIIFIMNTNRNILSLKKFSFFSL